MNKLAKRYGLEEYENFKNEIVVGSDGTEAFKKISEISGIPLYRILLVPTGSGFYSVYDGEIKTKWKVIVK